MPADAENQQTDCPEANAAQHHNAVPITVGDNPGSEHGKNHAYSPQGQDNANF